MKKLAVLGAVFLALGAFVYFYEIRGQDERERQQKLEESLFGLEEDAEIASIRLETSESEPVALEREGDAWMLTAPVSARADQSSVDALLRRVTEARRERMLEEPGDLTEFGLADSATRLTVVAGGLEKTLLLGGESFQSGQLYARFQDSEEIIVTSSMLKGAMTKDVSDWRDRSLLRFERGDLEALEVTAADRTVALEKRDDQWYLTAPVQERADQSTVSSLLTTLDGAQAEDFVAADDAAGFGLDQPEFRVRLLSAGSEAWRTLEIGPERDGQRYAREAGRPQFVTVAESLIDGLGNDLFDYRDKDVVGVTQKDIARLRLESPGQTLVLVHQDFKWTVEEPAEQKDKEALSYKFWYPIDDMEFEAIDDEEAGDFSSPDVRLTLELTDGSSVEFLFVADGGVYRARRGSDGRQGRISEESYQKLLLTAEEIV